MSEHAVHTHFPGRLIFIGFGSIGQGVLPLILRHLGGLTRGPHHDRDRRRRGPRGGGASTESSSSIIR